MIPPDRTLARRALPWLLLLYAAARIPALVAYNLDRWATRAQIHRVLNDVFKPAVDDCLRLSASE